VRNENIYRQG